MSLPEAHHALNSYTNRGAGIFSACTGPGNLQSTSYTGPVNFFSGPQYNNALPFNRDEKQVLAEEKQACLRSLSFRNIDARRHDIALAHPQTCDWLFKTTEFRRWLDRTNIAVNNGVLWIKGNPGTGKSTLMKHTLKHCRDNLKDHILVAHFFNARGDESEKTRFGMLRSLVLQLLEDDSIYQRFVPYYRSKCQRHQPGEWEWQESELKDFLLAEITRPKPKRLVLLVDALDECSERHVRDVVQFLEDLSIRAVLAKTILHVCLSSRHYPHITIEKYQELVVEKREEHDEDISIYVRDKLRKCDEKIEKGVLEKASGIFMWVVLVVSILNKAYDEGKIEAMQQKLDEVPKDLDTLFWTILEDNPDERETILMLQWVLFAKRRLTPSELYHATLAGINADTLGPWDSSKMTPYDIRRRITHSSRGLIEVRKGKVEQVQFIHESVSDFLLRNRRLQSLDPALELNPIGTIHDRLKACCMSYILMDALPEPKDMKQAKRLGPDYPFLEYASTHVFDHAEAGELGHVPQISFLRQLIEKPDVLERVRLLHNSFEPDSEITCIKAVGLLYMLAIHGHKGLTRGLLERGAEVNLQGGHYGTALQAAAYRGHEAIVVKLLERGAEVNLQGGHFGTALQAAAAGRHDVIVTILREHRTKAACETSRPSKALTKKSWALRLKQLLR